EVARREAAARSRRRKNVERALAHLEEARVNTIHGFCADLLRERPVEAEVDPQFQVMTEPESERLYAEAFNLWLQEQLENPPEGVRRSLRRESSFRPDDSPIARLRKAGWDLVSWRDFPAPWQRTVFAREPTIDSLVSELHIFADLTERCTNPGRDGFYWTTHQARQLSADIRTMEAVRPRDYDGLEAKLIRLGSDRDFGRLKGYGRQY